MKIRLGTLRRLIREATGSAWPGKPVDNVVSDEINSREALDTLRSVPPDTVADEEGLPDHLLDPNVDPEDCFGPVPPDRKNPNPYVGQDPFARDIT